ncbi:unnamed protein product [Dicrocoelium dendriticum]|nr:unnamed protein product [Dicrocoelium dendriticum]
MILDASERRQECYQSSTQADFNPYSFPVVLIVVSVIDVIVLEPDCRILEDEVTIGSELSELAQESDMYQESVSPENHVQTPVKWTQMITSCELLPITALPFQITHKDKDVLRSAVEIVS